MATRREACALVLVVAMSGGMTIGMCSYAFGSYVQPVRHHRLPTPPHSGCLAELTPPALVCAQLTNDFGWTRVQINVAMTVNFVVCALCPFHPRSACSSDRCCLVQTR